MIRYLFAREKKGVAKIEFMLFKILAKDSFAVWQALGPVKYIAFPVSQ